MRRYQQDTHGAWIGTEVLDYLSRITSWTEMVAGDEDGIDYNVTKADEIMVAAAGAQAALDKLIDAVTRAEELAATRAAELTHQDRSADPPAEADSHREDGRPLGPADRLLIMLSQGWEHPGSCSQSVTKPEPLKPLQGPSSLGGYIT